ncbi:ABC transporter ATP-binding protein [Paenibacillus filicis]|uniref:ABC transporter ATP-binding protein n=1 Tax=Paenibacillus gyeongsangnamensis TaxID=3388067 RepID=A0ABT4Q3S6_9BACL|nr:ABC transporter ATP-binding protein [Paenibacillus filicis]MCZ8511518.1 ABC transporter ATP-binding protein [Paenibacillus filicis]
MKRPLLEVKDLKKHFPLSGGMLQGAKNYVKAVDGIDLEIFEGETFSLVGESGCGKSTLGRTIIRLMEPTEGEIKFGGQAINSLTKKQLLPFRKDMQLIFQDPYASLNPRKRIGETLREPFQIHQLYSTREQKEKIYELLRHVGLNEDAYTRFPHEFSGGQRQRIVIARALALSPKFIVCDEAVSALDVSIQSQIINLLKKLQNEYNITYLFISHNLNVVKYISDRVAVMYLGKIVESAPKGELFKNPLHPYTQALISAIPLPNPEKERSRERIILEGDVPSPVNPPKGCRFHTRCPMVKPVCKEVEPTMIEMENSHKIACHLYN